MQPVSYQTSSSYIEWQVLEQTAITPWPVIVCHVGETASVEAATCSVLKRTCYHTFTVEAGALLYEHIHTACNQVAELASTHTLGIYSHFTLATFPTCRVWQGMEWQGMAGYGSKAEQPRLMSAASVMLCDMEGHEHTRAAFAESCQPSAALKPCVNGLKPRCVPRLGT